nr:hypothetical protein [Mycolicibacterium sp. CBMA 226]
MSEVLMVGPDADEAALLGRMAELERAKSAAAAEQAQLAAVLEARRIDAARAGGPRVSRAGLGSEVGLARGESAHRGERLMAMARILVADMPCTLAALAAGRLSGASGGVDHERGGVPVGVSPPTFGQSIVR